jgi:hypothetical protein
MKPSAILRISAAALASGDRTPWLREGGKGSLPLAVHFQLRPNPLAR